MLIRVHYSVNNHHIARSVLEEASPKTGNKSVLKTQCVIFQHMMEKVQSMISVMALLDRNYIRQTTVSRGNAVVDKSISSAPFFRLFFTTSSHRHHQMSARNVGSVCSYRSISWHDSMFTKTNISKHFTQQQMSLPTSSREIPCCYL